MVTYKDCRQFPMTKWTDVTDWPPLDSLASQGYSIIGVNMEKAVEAADKETKAAFDNYRNQLVQQNCHRDVEIRLETQLLIMYNVYLIQLHSF